MKTLLSTLYQAYLSIPNREPIIEENEFSAFINDEDACAKFLSNTVFNVEIEEYKSQIKLKHPRYRARHSVITYLMGIAFSEMINLNNTLFSIFHNDGIEIKTRSPYEIYDLVYLTFANHDFGYFSTYSETKYELGEILKFNNIKPKEYLLCQYNMEEALSGFHAHKLEDIEKYYYIYHNINNDLRFGEENEHGIVGGILLFNKIMKKIYKSLPKEESNFNYMNRDFSSNDFPIIYGACVTIAQHNIYKSSDKKFDKYYNDLPYLKYNEGFNITLKTPLLLMLSLVDTVDIIKRLSKKEEENNGKYIQTKTILQKILVNVDSRIIEIDFSFLYNHRDDKEIKNAINKHVDSIVNLSTWTQFKTKKSVHKIAIEI